MGHGGIFADSNRERQTGLPMTNYSQALPLPDDDDDDDDEEYFMG